MRESDWEQLALERLAKEPLGWQPLTGRDIAPEATSAVGHPAYAALGEQPQRESWSEPAIPSRFRAALRRLNPNVPLRQVSVSEGVPAYLTSDRLPQTGVSPERRVDRGRRAGAARGV